MQNRFLIVISVLLVALTIQSNALPARKRMIYYHQPAGAQWYAAAPQRMMYVQYVQPSQTYARSTQAASALVAGETVATGTYLADCNHAETDVAAVGPTVQRDHQQHGEDVLSIVGAHGAHSVAEAYPDDSYAAPVAPPTRALTVETDAEQPGNAGTVIADVPAVVVATDEEQPTVVQSDDAAKVPRDYNFASKPAPAPELPAPAPIAPVAPGVAITPPARRYLPSKKKVYVELEQSAETDLEQPETDNSIAVADEDESHEQDEEETAVAVPVVPAPKKPIYAPSAHRPSAKKPVKPGKVATVDCTGCTKAASSKPKPPPQLPAGTFFPIDFGGTAGGAIAIANSFSTGEGGSATSHAIAYGSPETVRARVRPSKLH